eukprot:5187597-Prymnesium_polylepis.1
MPLTPTALPTAADAPTAAPLTTSRPAAAVAPIPLWHGLWLLPRNPSVHMLHRQAVLHWLSPRRQVGHLLRMGPAIPAFA